MESRRERFHDRLATEIGARYERLKAGGGGRPVLPPSDGLLDAFVEVLEPTWRSDSDPAIQTSIEWAAEAYEYLVGRWPDPRWRVLVSIALDVGVRGRASAPTRAPTPAPKANGNGRRHRSAGSYSRELTLGGVEL
jgi:hypothetical protein